MASADEAGAAAAARYFLTLYAYIMRTGDVTTWNSMSWETCQFCARSSELATTIRNNNETFSGAEITPISTFNHPFDDLIGAYPVDVEFTQEASERRDAQGTLINVSEPDEGTLGVDLIRQGDGWKVLAVTAQDTP